MFNRINKTSICSVVFLDIVGYSKQPAADQVSVKEFFNAIVADSVKNIIQTERIILDTGDGAAISLIGEPEEALFISLAIRNKILEQNRNEQSPLLVRIGINLGSVRLVNDINGRPNVIGDGINVAQRIMSFAEPNQILISRSYFEVVSRLTEDFSNMFSYFGIKQDKHVREHEVYQINPAFDKTDHKEGLHTIANLRTKPVKSHKISTKVKTVSKNYYVPAFISVLAIVTSLFFGVYSQAKNVDTSGQPVVLAKAQATQIATLKSNETEDKVSEASLKPIATKTAPEKKKIVRIKKQIEKTKKPVQQIKVAQIEVAQIDNGVSKNSNIKEVNKTIQTQILDKPCSQTQVLFNQCQKY